MHVGARVHADGGELGQVPGHRIVELEPALLPQLHQRHPGDRLGHREDLHEGVARHRSAGFAVGLAERPEVGLASVLVDQRRHARQLAGRDVPGKHAVDAFAIDAGDIGRALGGRRRFRCTG